MVFVVVIRLWSIHPVILSLSQYWWYLAGQDLALSVCMYWYWCLSDWADNSNICISVYTCDRSDKMSEFGRGSASSGSSSNLYRSQSMASLAGDKMVLGEGFRGSYTLMRPQKAAAMKELGLNAKALSRIPKTPRPLRALDVFDAVIKGLRYLTMFMICLCALYCALLQVPIVSAQTAQVFWHLLMVEYSCLVILLMTTSHKMWSHPYRVWISLLCNGIA